MSLSGAGTLLSTQECPAVCQTGGRQGTSGNPDGGESGAGGSLREVRNGSVSRREGTWETRGGAGQGGDAGALETTDLWGKGVAGGADDGAVSGEGMNGSGFTDVLHARPACAHKAGHRCE